MKPTFKDYIKLALMVFSATFVLGLISFAFEEMMAWPTRFRHVPGFLTSAFILYRFSKKYSK
ncbi:hypothetical protein OAK75_06065 [Bacteriovoracales bacterium]|nr:hypothetical protein [Bacteriovoracales bacterium]